MLTFSEKEIRESVPTAAAIGLMREAFTLLSSNEVVVPIRTAIPTGDSSATALFMPSFCKAWNLFGLKMVGVFPHNPRLNLPVIRGQMLVMDATNGEPLAMLDASTLTALRTGAASGLATEILSREDSSILAIFGTGAQAISQIEGVLAVRPIRKILVMGTSREKEINFCKMAGKKFQIEIIFMEKPDDLLHADIVCTATTSNSSIFSDRHLKSGAHVNAIGSFKPTMQEIPSDTVRRSLLVVDQRKAVLEEAGDLVVPMMEKKIAPQHIHAELGEIISGLKGGRTSPDQLTVFKSVGNAIQDLAVARYLIEREG